MRVCILTVLLIVACGQNEEADPKSEDTTAVAKDAAPLPPVDGVNRATPGRSSTPRATVFLRKSSGGAGLPKEVVRRIARRYVARFKVCYDKGLAENPSLEGIALASFQVAADGRPSGVTVTGIDDATVAPCLVEIVRTIQLPAKDGREMVAASVEIELWGATNSDDVKVLHRDKNKKAADYAEVARRELRRARPLLVGCYDRGRRAGAAPGQKLWVTFVVDGKGAPSDVAAGGLGAGSVESCIVDVVKKLAYHPNQGTSGEVAVDITFPR